MKQSYNIINLKWLSIVFLILFVPLTGSSQTFFRPDEQGFIRHWYNSGIRETKYAKPYSQEPETLRRLKQEVYDTPLDFPVPDGENFDPRLAPGISLRLLSMGENLFVENFKFHFLPTVIESYSLTGLYAHTGKEVRATLMAEAGSQDLWCNGVPVNKVRTGKIGRYDMYKVILPLKIGVNTIFVRQIDLAARDNRLNFALRLDSGHDIEVVLPGNPQTVERFYQAEEWLYSVELSRDGTFHAPGEPFFPVRIEWDNNMKEWPRRGKSVNVALPDKVSSVNFRLNIVIDDSHLGREFEIGHIAGPDAFGQTLEKVRANLMSQVLEAPPVKDYPFSGQLIIKLRQGIELTAEDYRILEDILEHVNRRMDCADFYLAFIQRLYIMCGDRLETKYRKAVEDAMLDFRYWSDEEGNNGMWMWSENHRILFHSCQMIAGKLFPDNHFTASGRTGREQAGIGEARVAEWIAELEKYGSDEFQSASYLHVLLLGMLNVVDFADSENLTTRMTALVDTVIERAALTIFDGICLGAQGRIYDKEVMDPEDSGKQSIMSWLTTSARPAFNLWVTTVMTSTYKPLSNIDNLAVCEVDTVYADGGAEVNIFRKKDFLISALTLPSPIRENVTGKDIYIPGRGLYQQHLWEAAVGARARVFVTHPGSSYAFTNNRPGYWSGNSIAPTLRMQRNMVVEIFDTPLSYPYQFTHAYFPQYEFDSCIVDGNWVFGTKGEGYIALWCSDPLEEYRNGYGNCELRSATGQCAWVCIVSSKDEEGDAESFIKRMKNLDPRYDNHRKVVSFGTRDVLGWNDTDWRAY